MDPVLIKFFDSGRRLRMNWNSGSVVMVEPHETIVNIMKDYISKIFPSSLLPFSEVGGAIDLLLSGFPIKCVLINMGITGTSDLLSMLDKKYPHIVCIVYGGDENILRQVSSLYNRVVVICNSDSMWGLLESLMDRIRSLEIGKTG